MTGSTPIGDRLIDHWRCAEGAPLRALVAQVLDTLDRHETNHRLRQRKRKGSDLQRWERLVEAVVCELALAVLDPPETGRVVIPLRYRNRPLRYREPSFGECLPVLLDRLHDLRLISRRVGKRHKSDATSCTPERRFVALVTAFDIKRDDLGRLPTRGDPVVLTRTVRVGRQKEKTWVGYEDTPDTVSARAEMAEINAYLAAADIEFVQDDGSAVDAEDRWLSCRFVVREDAAPSFKECGRLFGGFWQPLSKARREHIRLAGEPVAELDYSAAFARIALAEKGIAPPADLDLYAIPGLESVLTRKQVKAAVSTFLFTKPGMTRWPHTIETGEDVAGRRFPKSWTPKKVRDLVLAHQPALADAFATTAGYRLMWTESEIMVRCLLHLSDEDIPALPLHDALLVPQSVVSQGKAIMAAASAEVIGLPIPVLLKLPSCS